MVVVETTDGTIAVASAFHGHQEDRYMKPLNFGRQLLEKDHHHPSSTPLSPIAIALNLMPALVLFDDMLRLAMGLLRSGKALITNL
ncbi:hypothetical protein TRIUR3_32131 [Triticum urartu]|uniref:Uncharacterized protein n=1 Tax=Triticum urartu TaxID=4572 RepID=M8A822_TRIUA|nr:hypothetical protein TRIUR3_32131 [Triticum urartu]